MPTRAASRIPAHWLDNRWGQEWPGMVAAANLDDTSKAASPSGSSRPPNSFRAASASPGCPAPSGKSSDLYPVKPGDPRKKNTHASCWHVDLNTDIRSLMSVEPNPGGSSPRTTSWATAITTSPIPAPRCRRCCASGRTPPSTKAWANSLPSPPARRRTSNPSGCCPRTTSRMKPPSSSTTRCPPPCRFSSLPPAP